MIHEGTHGIQALDLLGRKVMQQQGAGLQVMLEEIGTFCDANTLGSLASMVIRPPGRSAAMRVIGPSKILMYVVAPAVSVYPYSTLSQPPNGVRTVAGVVGTSDVSAVTTMACERGYWVASFSTHPSDTGTSTDGPRCGAPHAVTRTAGRNVEAG